MASTLIQFRIEKDEKQRSSQILETMGLFAACISQDLYDQA